MSTRGYKTTTTRTTTAVGRTAHFICRKRASVRAEASFFYHPSGGLKTVTQWMQGSWLRAYLTRCAIHCASAAFTGMARTKKADNMWVFHCCSALWWSAERYPHGYYLHPDFATRNAQSTRHVRARKPQAKRFVFFPGKKYFISRPGPTLASPPHARRGESEERPWTTRETFCIFPGEKSTIVDIHAGVPGGLVGYPRAY